MLGTIITSLRVCQQKCKWLDFVFVIYQLLIFKILVHYPHIFLLSMGGRQNSSEDFSWQTIYTGNVNPNHIFLIWVESNHDHIISWWCVVLGALTTLYLGDMRCYEHNPQYILVIWGVMNTIHIIFWWYEVLGTLTTSYLGDVTS